MFETNLDWFCLVVKNCTLKDCKSTHVYFHCKDKEMCVCDDFCMTTKGLLACLDFRYLITKRHIEQKKSNI
jgi:hypothetical protein